MRVIGMRATMAYPTLLALGALDAAGYSVIAPVLPQIAARTGVGSGCSWRRSPWGSWLGSHSRGGPFGEWARERCCSARSGSWPSVPSAS